MLSVMVKNVIVYIAISRRSFVSSQSHAIKVPTSLSDVGGLAARALDIINRSLSVVRFVVVFNAVQLMSLTVACEIPEYM